MVRTGITVLRKLSSDPLTREEEYFEFIAKLAQDEQKNVRGRPNLLNFWNKPLANLRNGSFGNPITATVAREVFQGVLSEEDMINMDSQGVFTVDQFQDEKETMSLQDLKKS